MLEKVEEEENGLRVTWNILQAVCIGAVIDATQHYLTFSLCQTARAEKGQTTAASATQGTHSVVQHAPIPFAWLVVSRESSKEVQRRTLHLVKDCLRFTLSSLAAAHASPSGPYGPMR